MRQKRMGIGAIKTSFGAVRPNDQKGTFVADSPDSGLVYPRKVGLASHIRNGNFVEVCHVARVGGLPTAAGYPAAHLGSDGRCRGSGHAPTSAVRPSNGDR
jgi:hypothetical protein